MLSESDFQAIRTTIANFEPDLSNDAVGSHVPSIEDMFAPAAHSRALDPQVPVVVGSRGAGKSFWSGVLGQRNTREAAALAYPRLGLDKISVGFGFTGAIGGASGISVDHLNSNVPEGASAQRARAFWWATIMLAIRRDAGHQDRLSELVKAAEDVEEREEFFISQDERISSSGKRLLVVFDALDAISNEWARRRLLTEALFEVVWALRAYRAILPKVFIRPDQIDDDLLVFTELPKLRTGAVRLTWSGADLYGLLFARLALSTEGAQSFQKFLRELSLPLADLNAILERRWPLTTQIEHQSKAMTLLAGPYMSAGPHGYKKGKTFEWPLRHLGDSFEEVTPRSFLGLMIGAAKRGTPPKDRALTPDGIRHGLREASKTRVDQLHLEFKWIKGVLAPLAGLLLPQGESEVFRVWKAAKTLKAVLDDSVRNRYLPPFDTRGGQNEKDLFEALRRIGVMYRRKDERLDMPDLFRVAARLLKKGGTSPI